MTRRGVVLLATFIIVVIAAITAGAIIQTTTVQRLGLAASGARAQSRALAWSGVLGAMTELHAQREQLLRGGDPELTSDWTVYETESGERGIVRLRLIAGRFAQPEAARLDLNSATEQMLANLEAIGPTLASRLAAATQANLFGSVSEALHAAGLTDNAALASLVTVFAADPLLQAGIGPEGNRSAGQPCIAVHETWDDPTRRALERRFPAPVLDALQPAPPAADESPPPPPQGEPPAPPARREPPRTQAELIQRLRAAGLPQENLAEALDTFSTDSGDFRFGRIDVLRAPEPVLRCIPGVDEAAAAAIVQRRDSLDAESRLNAAWLLTEGALTEEQFLQAAPHVTTRCLQWRIVVEAGIEDAGSLDIPGERTPLRNRAALEAVIDLAGERPRVAYLRDVTLLDAAAAVADLRGPDESDAALEPDAPAASTDSPPALPSADEGKTELDALSPRGLDLDTDLDIAAATEDPDPAEPGPNTAQTPSSGQRDAGEGNGAGSRGRIGRWRSR